MPTLKFLTWRSRIPTKVGAFKTFIESRSDSLFSCHEAEDYFDVWALKMKTTPGTEQTLILLLAIIKRKSIILVSSNDDSALCRCEQ